MPTKRKPLTIQLHPKLDADILFSIQQLSNGHRNAEIKAVLRAGFNIPDRQAGSSCQDERLVEELELLRRMVKQNTAQIEELKQQNVWLKQALEDLPSYLATVIQQVAASAPLPNAPSGVEIEESPRLDENSLRQRAAKMRKAKW